MKTQATIIGAGIGGLATALALKQKGIECQIYEQASILKEVGANLVLAPNALAALDKLGLKNTIEAASWPIHHAVIAQQNGLIVQDMNTHALENRYGYGMRAIHRGRLQQILAEALMDTPLRLGHKLESAAIGGQEAHLRFSNGKAITSSLVIGADGIHSSVRKQVFGDVPVVEAGQVCWRAMVKVGLEDAHTSFEYWGNQPGVRFGLVPAGSGETYLYATTTMADERANGHSAKAALIHLAQAFSYQVQQVVASLEEDAVHQASLQDLSPMATWIKGPVALLGDAAHATTPNLGQGACQALEDALVLAECLCGATSIPAGLNAYEAQRKVKAEYVVRLSRRVGKTVQAPAWLKPIVFSAMRAMPKAVTQRQFDALYR